jgi:hypothetical protein
MANENINLATFSFDETKLIDSITKTKQAFLQLKLQQQDNNKIISEYQKSINSQISSQDILKKSGLENSDVYKKNDADLKILVSSQSNIIKANTELGLKINGVSSELRLQETVLKGTATTVAGTATPYANLNSELNKLKLESKNLGAEMLILERAGQKNTAEYKNLETQYKAVTATAKELDTSFKAVDKAVGDTQRSVGDYKDQIKEAFSEMNIFNGGISGFVARSQEAGGAGNLLKNSFGGISQGIVGMTKASLGFIMTPLGAVIATIGLVLAPLISYFTKTQEGIDKINSVTKPLMAIFSGLIGVLQNLGKSMFEAFSNPKKTLEDLSNFIKQNLINRFTAFSVILDGIINLDFKKISNGMIQAGTGVENATDKIKNAGKATSKFLEDAAKKGSEIARLGREITDGELKYQRTARETGDLIDAQLLISKDTSKTFAERETASRKIIELTKNLGIAEEAIIDKKIRQLKIQMSLGSVTNDQKKQLEDLLNAKEDAGDRGIEAEKEQLRVIAGAKKEAMAQQEKANEEAKKRNEKANEDKKKEAEAQIATAKELANTQIETAKLALTSYLQDNQSKLTDAKRLTEALIEEEKKRLEAVYQKNRDIIVNETIAKQKQLDIEINALKNKQGVLTESEKTHLADLQLQKTNNVIESNNKEKELFDNHKKSLNEIDKNFENQTSEEKKIKRAQEFQLLLTEMETNGATEEQIKLIQLDREKEIELQKLKEKEDAKFLQNVEQRLAQDELITEEQAIKDELNLQLQTTKDESEKVRIQNQLDAINILETANAQKKIELSRITEATRRADAAQTFGQIAELLGKETTVGKAAALAQATLSGINAVQNAYTTAQKSPITALFPAYPIVQAGLAGVFSATQVSKIAGFATGGIITDGQPISRRNGDDVLITAKRGEVILNQTQQAMLGGATTFSSIGVPGFATGGVVGSNIASVQNSITSQLDMSMLAETIGKAVFDGANNGTANGSQKGIIGLSENRQIANNANF